MAADGGPEEALPTDAMQELALPLQLNRAAALLKLRRYADAALVRPRI